MSTAATVHVGPPTGPPTGDSVVLERFVGEIRQIERCIGEESCPKQLSLLIQKTAVSSSGASFGASSGAASGESKNEAVNEAVKEAPKETACGNDWRDQLLHIQKRKIRELDCFLKIVIHKLSPRTTPLQEEYETKVDAEREKLIMMIRPNSCPPWAN
jgi:hypothetical protein